jgi:hypothetical protein
LKFLQIIRKKINKILVAKKKATSDFYLYKYKSYADYKNIQTFHNKRKINKTWATEKILNIVIRNIKDNYKKNRYVGLCHGTRNGFEQNYIASKLNVSIIGTDISETATQFPKSIVWDFHKPKKEWLGSCDFVYSNSNLTTVYNGGNKWHAVQLDGTGTKRTWFIETNGRIDESEFCP